MLWQPLGRSLWKFLGYHRSYCGLSTTRTYLLWWDGVHLNTPTVSIWAAPVIMLRHRNHCSKQQLLWHWIQTTIYESYFMFWKWKILADLLSHTTWAWFRSPVQCHQWSWSKMYRYVLFSKSAWQSDVTQLSPACNRSLYILSCTHTLLSYHCIYH